MFVEILSRGQRLAEAREFTNVAPSAVLDGVVYHLAVGERYYIPSRTLTEATFLAFQAVYGVLVLDGRHKYLLRKRERAG